VPARVIWWGTGFVGKLGLAALLDHPEYELAGLIVHSREKVGKDAGEILGRAPVGVIATDDVDAALALDADAVAYMATGDNRYEAAVGDLCRALRAGKDVVSVSLVPLLHPEGASRALVEPLERACRESGRSLFVSGCEPGVFSDLVPMNLAGLCARVRGIKVYELADWSTFDNTQFMSDIGFGRPLDAKPVFFSSGFLTALWHGPIQTLAEGLGVKLDGIREWNERLPATRRIELPGSLGVIEPGTCAAIHFAIEGIVGGEPRISIEHFNTMGEDQAPPHWPRIEGGHGYRVEIDGDPEIRADIAIRGPGGDFNLAGCLITAWRPIAAIEAVRAAKPGILTPLDLPILPGRGNLY